MSKSNISNDTATFVKYLKSELSAEFFMGRNGEPIVTVRESGKKKSFNVESSQWRSWTLLRLRRQKLAPTKNRLDYVRDELIALAHESGDQRDICVRVGGDSENVYVDLGCADFKVAHISKDGFKIIDNCPITFLRPHKQLQLPVPVKCIVEDFLPLFKKWYLGTNRFWPLLLAFILKSLHRDGGAFVFLILFLHLRLT